MQRQLLRFSVLAPAALTGLMAVLVVGFMAAANDWSVVRILPALIVVGMAIFTVRHVLRGGSDFALLAGGFALALIGAAGVTYGFLQTVDPEYWAIMFCILLTVQGGTAINYVWIYKQYV